MEECDHSISTLKKGGGVKKTNNYRWISLLEIGYKVLPRLLLTRAEEQLDSTVGDYQEVLRKNKDIQNRCSP